MSDYTSTTSAASAASTTPAALATPATSTDTDTTTFTFATTIDGLESYDSFLSYIIFPLRFISSYWTPVLTVLLLSVILFISFDRIDYLPNKQVVPFLSDLGRESPEKYAFQMFVGWFAVLFLRTAYKSFLGIDYISSRINIDDFSFYKTTNLEVNFAAICLAVVVFVSSVTLAVVTSKEHKMAHDVFSLLTFVFFAVWVILDTFCRHMLVDHFKQKYIPKSVTRTLVRVLPEVEKLVQLYTRYSYVKDSQINVKDEDAGRFTTTTLAVDGDTEVMGDEEDGGFNTAVNGAFAPASSITDVARRDSTRATCTLLSLSSSSSSLSSSSSSSSSLNSSSSASTSLSSPTQPLNKTTEKRRKGTRQNRGSRGSRVDKIFKQEKVLILVRYIAAALIITFTIFIAISVQWFAHSIVCTIIAPIFEYCNLLFAIIVLTLT